MAKEMKAADLIGKTIEAPEAGAKYVIKSVSEDGTKLITDYYLKGKDKPFECPITMTLLEANTKAGKWRLEGTDINPQTSTDEVEEVTDVTLDAIKPKMAEETAKTIEMPKKKSEGRGKKSETKAKKSDVSHQPSAAYHVQLLTSKKGRQWPKLYGFASEDEAKAMADRMADGISASWDYGMNDEGRESKTRHWHLKAVSKFCGLMQELCDALNRGDQAAIDKAVKASKEEQPNHGDRLAYSAGENHKPVPVMSAEDYAVEMIERLMRGEELPESIVKRLNPETVKAFISKAA